MKNALLLLTIVLAACGKDGDSGDSQNPVINVSSPTANQVFTGGQSVSINAAISDNDKLKRIHLEIINTTTGLVITHEHYPTAEASYSLNKTFTTAAATAYRIKVEAEDGADNKTTTEITVSAN